MRYVPQSRYFQRPELEIAAHTLEPHLLKQLNEQERITIVRVIEGERVRITSNTIKGVDRHV